MSRSGASFPVRLAMIAGLLALLVRAVIPAGFMLAPTGQGGAGPIPIVLCTEGGTIQALLAADGSLVEDGGTGDKPAGNDGHSDGGVDHAACVFAHGTAATGPVDPAGSAAAPLMRIEAPAGAMVLDLVPGRGLAAPPPPATAPPVLI